jgi:hypothetical protein
MLKTAANTYYLLFGPGQTRFEDGISVKSNAAFSLFRDRGASAFVGGTTMEVGTVKGQLRMSVDKPASVSAELAESVATIDIAGDLQYDTYGGIDHYRPKPAVRVTIDGDLWRVTQRLDRLTGQPVR